MGLAEEELAKEEGMARAAATNAELLGWAREIAFALARTGGPITVDDVRSQMLAEGLPFRAGNWMGSIFKGKDWEVVGERKASHTGGHARRILLWRRK